MATRLERILGAGLLTAAIGVGAYGGVALTNNRANAEGSPSPIPTAVSLDGTPGPEATPGDPYTILNNEDFKSFSVARSRVEPGITTEVHKLIDTDEVYYILSGKGEMEVDGELMGVVVANDLIFIPKNSKQRIKNTAYNDLLFLCICSPRFDGRNYQ